MVDALDFGDIPVLVLIMVIINVFVGEAPEGLARLNGDAGIIFKAASGMALYRRTIYAACYDDTGDRQHGEHGNQQAAAALSAQPQHTSVKPQFPVVHPADALLPSHDPALLPVPETLICSGTSVLFWIIIQEHLFVNKKRTYFWNICLLFTLFYDILLNKAGNIAKTMNDMEEFIAWGTEKFPRNRVKY